MVKGGDLVAHVSIASCDFLVLCWVKKRWGRSGKFHPHTKTSTSSSIDRSQMHNIVYGGTDMFPVWLGKLLRTNIDPNEK